MATNLGDGHPDDAGAREGHVVHIQRQAFGEFEGAFANLDDITGLGVLQAALQLGVGLRAGRDCCTAYLPPSARSLGRA
ncbi:MAG: hypothetical protein HC937_01375 [Aquincola sp.]|nr:hypothetical protein [Aquincola sp.]